MGRAVYQKAACFAGEVNHILKRCKINSGPRLASGFPGPFEPMALSTAFSLFAGLTRTTRAALTVYPLARLYAGVLFGVAVSMFYRGSREDVYNILWAVVFGFATLNILTLAARRLEPTRRGLSFGELMAVVVVLLSVFLLGWEMLNLFHVFPIKLKHR